MLREIGTVGFGVSDKEIVPKITGGENGKGNNCNYLLLPR